MRIELRTHVHTEDRGPCMHIQFLWHGYIPDPVLTQLLEMGKRSAAHNHIQNNGGYRATSRELREWNVYGHPQPAPTIGNARGWSAERAKKLKEHAIASGRPIIAGWQRASLS